MAAFVYPLLLSLQSKKQLEHTSYLLERYSYSSLDNTLGMLPIFYESLYIFQQVEKQKSPLTSCFVNMKHKK